MALQVTFYDTIEGFYLAESLEYLESWRQATPARPAGCVDGESFDSRAGDR